MKQLTNFNKKYIRFQNEILSSINYFNNGDDNLGLDTLLNALEDLNNILDASCYLEEFILNIDKLLEALQTLLGNINNNDIVGMVDTIELEIYPLIKEWDGGIFNDCCETE